MPADKTAMGSMPTAGFQYCESLVQATSHGFQVFSPRDAVVRYSGSGIEIKNDDKWGPLQQLPLDDECIQSWRNIAPHNFTDRLPPFLQRFFIPDTVQVFSGMFVSCAPEWSILVRPIVNVPSHDHVLIYEGIIEADIFQPVPLFINIKFLSKDQEFHFERFRPLFQVQPILRHSYTKNNITVERIADTNKSDFDWQGLNQTTRIFTGSSEELELGAYKKLVRRRRKREP